MATDLDAPLTASSVDCDMLIIDGGPAGSTAAALLARRVHRVTLLEKARHLRFHIGESLLPANLPLLENLGVAEKIKAIGMEKWEAQFISPWHDHVQPFQFADALNKHMPMSYQVRRSEFDEILLRKGARVMEGCQALHVDFSPGGVTVQTRHENGAAQTVHARYLIDASGRDTFLANRLKMKRSNPAHNSAAIYAHFRGATSGVGKSASDFSIFWFDCGWFWFIPLADGVTSVGAVVSPHYLKTRKGRPLAQFLEETVALCPHLKERLKDAQLAFPAEATGNHSYVSDRTQMGNHQLLGDAYTFIDPVFSSGVMLAMQSAFAGAEVVDACLREPQRAAQALRRFDRLMRHVPRIYSWFICRVTNSVLRVIIMAPRNIFRVKETVLSVLAGDLFGRTRTDMRLLISKAFYYIGSALSPLRTLKAARMRSFNIRNVGSIDEPGAASH